jgi:hypothetical protein
MGSAAKAKLRQARKKKRVSKHILQSKNGGGDGEGDGDADAGGNNDDTGDAPESKKSQNKASSTSPASNKGTKAKTQKIKDPREAASYLTLWKLDQTGSDNKSSKVWKYNKNTQSWLLRHMYENDKVNKTAFATLMDYLEGLQGQSTIARVVRDAQRRALRYKSTTTANNEKDDTNNNEEAEAQAGVSGEDLLNAEEQAHDAKRWKGLDDHEKRREYKRARKVLEILQKRSENESS